MGCSHTGIWVAVTWLCCPQPQAWGTMWGSRAALGSKGPGCDRPKLEASAQFAKTF